MRATGLRAVSVTGGFWARKLDMVADEMLPHQWKALNDEVPGAEKSHAIENLRIAAGEEKGGFSGTVFQDSDVAKWIEAASYSLARRPDPGLEAHVDEAIRLFAAAQGPDGYVNSYFTVAAPGDRWRDLAWGHELYCAGHLIEAAVAHNACTGKTSLLDVARRYADCIGRRFGPGEGQTRGYCGHPEIELALFRLYKATGEPRYRDLAFFFVDERGLDPAAFDGKRPLGDYGCDIPSTRWFGRDYLQNHRPARGQADATGHAVRAMYLYSAMTDECLESGDPALRSALERLWESAVSRRMYVTGGVGSQAHGERFTTDFDLPPDRAYAETCASIGLFFWASRMARLEGDSRYADIAERAAYNGILSGVSLDGSRYFYVNPLELRPEIASVRQDCEHVRSERVPWLGCSCCPPNIARFIGSFAACLYSSSEDSLWVHHFASSEARLEAGGVGVALRAETEYPWEGLVRITVAPDSPADFALRIRLPEWCASWRCSVLSAWSARRSETAGPVESGYLVIARRWSSGDAVELELDMDVRTLTADARAADLAGLVAVQRGPLVFCAEEVDNGPSLRSLVVDRGGCGTASVERDLLGWSVRVELPGWREENSSRPEPGRSPYVEASPRLEPARIRLVPYHQWGNRGRGEMSVWLRCSR